MLRLMRELVEAILIDLPAAAIGGAVQIALNVSIMPMVPADGSSDLRPDLLPPGIANDPVEEKGANQSHR